MIRTLFGSKVLEIKKIDLDWNLEVVVDHEDCGPIVHRTVHISALRADGGVSEIIDAIGRTL
jgi:hypothetical protein